jgi:hypothetical protein
MKGMKSEYEFVLLYCSAVRYIFFEGLSVQENLSNPCSLAVHEKTVSFLFHRLRLIICIEEDE